MRKLLALPFVGKQQKKSYCIYHMVSPLPHRFKHCLARMLACPDTRAEHLHGSGTLGEFLFLLIIPGSLN